MVNANITRLNLPIVRLPITLNYQSWMAERPTEPVHVWHFANAPARFRSAMMRQLAQRLGWGVGNG